MPVKAEKQKQVLCAQKAPFWQGFESQKSSVVVSIGSVVTISAVVLSIGTVVVEAVVVPAVVAVVVVVEAVLVVTVVPIGSGVVEKTSQLASL